MTERIDWKKTKVSKNQKSQELILTPELVRDTWYVGFAFDWDWPLSGSALRRPQPRGSAGKGKLRLPETYGIWQAETLSQNLPKVRAGVDS